MGKGEREKESDGMGKGEKETWREGGKEKKGKSEELGRSRKGGLEIIFSYFFLFGKRILFL